MPRSVSITRSLPVERTLATAWVASSGAKNWPFLIFTGRPVRPAASSMSVWRHRKAGTCSRSTTRATASACEGRWKSVVTGKPVSRLTAASTFKPCSRPGPRGESTEVRLALSKDDL